LLPIEKFLSLMTEETRMYWISETLFWAAANWEWPAGVLLGVLIALCVTFLTCSLVRKAFIALDSWLVPNSSTTRRVMVKQATDDFYVCVEVLGKASTVRITRDLFDGHCQVDGEAAVE
jgi:hypothetical protein